MVFLKVTKALICASAERATDIVGYIGACRQMKRENGRFDSNQQDSGSAGISVRDKKAGDGIVSATNINGGDHHEISRSTVVPFVPLPYRGHF